MTLFTQGCRRTGLFLAEDARFLWYRVSCFIPSQLVLSKQRLPKINSIFYQRSSDTVVIVFSKIKYEIYKNAPVGEKNKCNGKLR